MVEGHVEIDDQHTECSSMIASALDACQKSSAAHSKWFRSLHDLYEASPQQFVESFVPQLNKVLTTPKLARNVVRVIDFIIKLALSPTESVELNGVLTDFIIKYCLMFCNSKEKAVRLSCCEIITTILKRLPDDAELDAETFDAICDAMIERSKDRIATIRCKAFSVLHRIHDPFDPQDPALLEMARGLNSDTSKDVRIECLNNIGVSESTLNLIVKRSKDISVDVRVAAYNTICNKVSMRSLKISQRVQLLHLGLYDRDERVSAAAHALLQQWFVDQHDKDMLSFLKALDIEHFEGEVEAIFQVLVHHIMAQADWRDTLQICSLNAMDSGEDQNAPKASFMQLEHLFALREVCAILKAKEELGELDALLPDVWFYCRLLKMSHESDAITSDIWRELLAIAPYLDTHDPACRKELVQQYRTLFQDTRASFEAPFEHLLPGMMRSLLAMNKHDVVFETLTSFHERHAAASPEGVPDLVPSHVAEQYSATAPLYRWFLIAQEFLVCSNIFVNPDAMSKMRSELTIDDLLKGIAHPDPRILAMAIKSLGLYAIYLNDERIATSQIAVLHHILQSNIAYARQTAIESIFDLASLFGIFESMDDDSQEMSIFCLFRDALYEQSEQRFLIAEGFAKLLFHGRIDSENNVLEVLSSFLLVLFDPESEHEPHLRQFLSMYLPNLIGQRGDVFKPLLMKAFLPSLVQIIFSPVQSSLSRIPLDKYIQYYIYLLEDKKEQEEPVGEGVHVTLQEQIGIEIGCLMLALMEVEDAPDMELQKTLAKSLQYLSLPRDDHVYLNRILFHLGDRRDIDSATLKHVDKVFQSIPIASSMVTVEQVDEHLQQKLQPMMELMVQYVQRRNASIPSSLSQKASQRTKKLNHKRDDLFEVESDSEASSDD